MKDKKEENFWWIDWPIAIVDLLSFAFILAVFLLWRSTGYNSTFEWYMIVCFAPLLLLVISWIRPLRVKGDRFIIGLDRIPSFRRYAISVNDIQKIDLWVWPLLSAGLVVDPDFDWRSVQRRYGLLIIFVQDKNGKKYKNIVTNIAIFKGLINKMLGQHVLSPEEVKILPQSLIPSQDDRNALFPTFITDLIEDTFIHGTVSRRDRKTSIENAESNTKECPYCKKKISETAIRCRYCRKILPGKAKNE